MRKAAGCDHVERVVIGRVDKAIDAAPFADGGLCGGLALVHVGYVERYGNSLATCGDDFLRDFFDSLLRPRGNDDFCAFTRCAATGGLPHAGACACHDDDLVFQDHVLLSRYGA
jgi:hypothetical protein